MPSIFPQLFAFSELAPFILRLVLGVIFIAHGQQKLFKVFGQTTQFFESIGIKPAKFWVVAVGIVELFSGIFLFVGFLTQIAAALTAINMLVATVYVKKIKFKKELIKPVKNNLSQFSSKAHFNESVDDEVSNWTGGYELNLLLLAAALALLFLGPGVFSFDLPL